MQRTLRGGGYHAIHKWLAKHYGKAKNCDNPFCSKKSKTFQWAKRKECSYEHNRDNFIQLCSSCHSFYDYTQERKDKIGKKSKGRISSPETRLKQSISCSGIHIGNKHSAKKIIQISLTGEVIKLWDCINDAAVNLEISPSGISMCARGKLKKSGGFKWSYVTR